MRLCAARERSTPRSSAVAPCPTARSNASPEPGNSLRQKRTLPSRSSSARRRSAGAASPSGSASVSAARQCSGGGLVRERGGRLLARALVIEEGALQGPGFGVVARQSLVVLGEAIVVDLLDGVGDAAVERAPPAREHALVGHVVRERVLEHVGELGVAGLLVDQLERAQLVHHRAEQSRPSRGCARAGGARTRGRSPTRSGARASRRRRAGRGAPSRRPGCGRGCARPRRRA